VSHSLPQDSAAEKFDLHFLVSVGLPLHCTHETNCDATSLDDLLIEELR
jgi:hypothetical protein